MIGTINFVLIGARNTGKTCYLSVLSCHCSGITAANDETTVYLKLQRQALDAGDLPQATASSMRELFFRYTGNQHKVDFSIDDYDGSFIESLSRTDTEDDASRLTLKDRIQKCEGLLFFMPYDLHLNKDALSNFEDELNTIISLAEEITDGKYATLPFPVAICVTKWDCSPDYQSSNEEDAALAYLDSIPCYQRIMAKINTLFRNVSIHPISAFGATEDGSHPIKGKITPYHLEAPLEFCLDKSFHRFSEKIEEFQKKEDEKRLFKYLFGLYHDLKHYRSGEYCQLYDDLEKQFSDKLLAAIRNDIQLVLTEEQIEIYNLIRQEALRHDIDQLLQSHHSSKQRKIKGVSITVLAVAIGGTAYYQMNHEEKEFSALRDTIHNQAIPMAEVLHKESAFNQHWTGFIKDKVFKADRKQLTLMTNDEIRKRLHTLTDGIDNRSLPDKDLIHKIKVFQNSISDWQDEGIQSTVENTLAPILNSYHTLETLRDHKGKAATLTLPAYAELKKSADAVVIRWREFDDVLKQIYTAVSNHIKLEAHNALVSNDVLDLEDSAENLEGLSANGDEEAASILKVKILPALNLVKIEVRFRQLLSSIGSEKYPSDIKTSVSEAWSSEYSDEHRAEIMELLQSKFAAYELKSMPSLRDLQSVDEIEDIKNKLSKIEVATSIKIAFDGDDERPFNFRYQRNEALQSKFDGWYAKVNHYDKTLKDGILVYVTFQGDGSDVNPLGFGCAFYKGNDIELTIDKSLTLPNNKDARYPCDDVDGSGPPSLTWKAPVTLKQGWHAVSVIEDDLVSDDTLNRNFRLNDADFFTFSNLGKIVKQITPYTLILSTK